MFYGQSVYPFVKNLEDNYPSILSELQNLEKTYFMDWPEKEIYNGKWTVFGFYKFGQRIAEHCDLCPSTARILENIPGMLTAGFSSLAAGTYLRPHVGYTNQVLRCHLGLVVPENCGIRVGDESRNWKVGEAFVFDDTIEHEAWNRSESTRVVLLLDFKKNLSDTVTFDPHLLQY
ncbi:aspartyl/asparaginyl beta-hydroxylase domain-containing protein [Trinickia sp. LjRoot230]|uniref:aspartyl/asparaginyl beta-hydroxylase domain-containing protein n=1 Tax=Trinickia sp. LjRoot230 TaxID=3342288 RepID=UPI003ECC36E2